MQKLALIPLLFVIACITAGVYGALHNQISYTVCPEYFTQFKFHQFRLPADIPHRWGAAAVGWGASWWMGLVIGAVLIPAGLVIRGPQAYFWGMLRVFGVVVATTIAVGLAALAVSFFAWNPDNAGQVSRYGNAIVDGVAFMRAGTMHNFSYLGGMIGIFSGLVTVYLLRRDQSSDKPLSI